MTDATEMELRVAKRIGAYYGLHGKKNVLKHINVARAAISVMREPTSDMNNAWDDLSTQPANIWRRIIDAALSWNIGPTPFRLRPEKEIPPRRKALVKPD